MYLYLSTCTLVACREIERMYMLRDRERVCVCRVIERGGVYAERYRESVCVCKEIERGCVFREIESVYVER